VAVIKCLEGMHMAQTVEKTGAPRLGTLLNEHQEAVMLGRELIRLAICARVANRVEDAYAAEQAAEDYIARAVQLEEQLRDEL
jgi:hypothetical protein